MKICGIALAPLWIPLERRLQTLAVLHVTLIFFFGGPVFVGYLIYLANTRYWFISYLYATWFIVDNFIWRTPANGGRPYPPARRWRLWDYYRDYFPIKLIKTHDLDPAKDYIIGYHPHGVLAYAAVANFMTEATNFSDLYPGIRPIVATLRLLYMFPLYREYLMFFGCIDCSRPSINHVLSQPGTGRAIVLLVGGAAEALDANPNNKLKVALRGRMGFVRIAITNGAHLVPVLTFGETHVFRMVEVRRGTFGRWLQRRLQQLTGVAPVLFHGRGIFQYTFGCMPYRHPIKCVVGSPIEVPHKTNPSRELVAHYHEKYLEEVRRLFDRTVKEHNVVEREIEIVDPRAY